MRCSPSWTQRRRLSDLIREAPSNFSDEALADLLAIVRRSIGEWGRAVADSTAIGHARRGVRRAVLFLVEAPWVIAYDPDTRQVLRILHGARNFPALFPDDEH